MNDRFLARGKCKDNGEWAEGYYIRTNSGRCFIKLREFIPPRACNDIFEVIPETVGGCTGLTDKNNKLMFDGDIVSLPGEDELSVIKWDVDSARFIIESDDVYCDFDNYWGYELEVVGNIHDDKPAPPENFEIFPA